jgi:hypothetical protein
MVTRTRHPFPEIYCDLNARMTDRGYSLQRNGSVSDLSKLGLTLESAVGRRFTFFMDDSDEEGNPDDIVFNGVVVHDPEWGYLAVMDDDDVYWRSQVSDV